MLQDGAGTFLLDLVSILPRNLETLANGPKRKRTSVYCKKYVKVTKPAAKLTSKSSKLEHRNFIAVGLGEGPWF